MAKTLDDIIAQGDKNLAKVRQNTDALDSIKTMVDGYKRQMTDLQSQLSAAAAAGDMGKIQQVADTMDAVTSALDAQSAAEAALANTDAEGPSNA